MSKKTVRTEPVEATVVEPSETSKQSRQRVCTGSIFWGCVFIGAGLLFLVDNLGIVQVHFENIWQLWPVLVIGAGFSMLSLRGFFGGLLSLLLVVALGALVWLVAIDNPYYSRNNESSWSWQEFVNDLKRD